MNPKVEEIRELMALWPWTAKQNEELARLRELAPSLLDFHAQLNKKKRRTEMTVEDLEQESERLRKQIMLQHVREAQKNTNLLSSPSNAAMSVLEEQIQLMRAFILPGATETMKQQVWPSYDFFPAEYVKMSALSAWEFIANTKAQADLEMNHIYLPQTTDDENIVTRYPTHIVSPEDSITSLLFTNKLTEDPQQITIDALFEREAKETSYAIASIDFKGLDRLTLSNGGKLSGYDKEVYKAICSLYVEGKNQYITPQMIYRTMTVSPTARITPRAGEKIVQTIANLRNMRIVVETPKRSGDQSSYYIDASILDAVIVGKKINGTVVDYCLKLSDVPVLFQYATSVNLVTRVETKLLKMDVNKTEEVIVLQGTLLSYIENMKRENISNKVYLFDEMYVDLWGNLKVTPKLAQSLRTNVNKILEHWENSKYIRAFSDVRSGHKKMGVLIEL